MLKFFRLFIEQFWRFFISLKLTFVLLVFIGIGAFLGMYFDQTLTFEEFLQINQQNSFYFLLNIFDLNDAFHSWWFSLVIVLLAFNLIVCSFERLPRIYFDAIAKRPYLTDRRLLGLSLKKSFTVSSYEEGIEKIKKFFNSSYQKLDTFLEYEFFYKEHDKYARFGVYVVHIALLIIMFSSIIATQLGVDATVLIKEGDKKRFVEAKGVGGITYKHDLGFYIGCKDFRLLTFSDNTPMEYESDLFIADEQNNIIKSQTVRVNNPLSYNGYTFYQSTFREIPQSNKSIIIVVKDVENKSDKKYTVDLNQIVKLNDNYSFFVGEFYEDFAGLGEAIRINIDKSGEKTFFHIFRRYPEYDYKVREDEYNFTFLATDNQYASGLSIGKVPGVSFIFLGFFILLIGLYLCFFRMPIRYFARITKKDDIFMIDVAAQAFRNQDLAKKCFLNKVSLIHKE